MPLYLAFALLAGAVATVACIVLDRLLAPLLFGPPLPDDGTAMEAAYGMALVFAGAALGALVAAAVFWSA